MLRVEFGKSVRKSTWRILCLNAPRTVGVGDRPGAVIHIRYDAVGFTVNGIGCSKDAERTVALCILQGIRDGQGHDALPVYTDFAVGGVN